MSEIESKLLKFDAKIRAENETLQGLRRRLEESALNLEKLAAPHSKACADLAEKRKGENPAAIEAEQQRCQGRNKRGPVGRRKREPVVGRASRDFGVRRASGA